ncbi:MAG: hypothetical protein ACTS22_01955 [Phycisphaerales bacterium]
MNTETTSDGPKLFRLRSLGLFARLGIAGFVVTMIGGTAASGAYLAMHHGDRDQREGLTVDDVRAHYHGIIAPSPLLESLEEGHPESLPDRERRLLVEWLTGDPATLSRSFDDLDLGIDAPAEIIAVSCMDCHARAATGDDAYPLLPLEYWDDVYKLAVSTDIRPVDGEILAASTHTHALGMASMGIAIGVLVLLTGWSRAIVSMLLGVSGIGLVADIGGWWLTRADPVFAPLVVAGGFAFNGGIVLMSLLILVDLCMPRPKRDRFVA